MDNNHNAAANNNNNNPQPQVEEVEEDDQRDMEDNHHHHDGEDDDDEDDEDDEEDGMDEEDDEDGGNGGEDDSFVEGGIAGAQEGEETRTLASEADIVLYFLCTESIKDHSDHPILKPGIKVRIGLGKNTRLSSCFARYVEVCNQVHSDAPSSLAAISVEDLEFVHAAVLKGQDTAEQGALMKDDVVRVRQNRWEEHDKEKEINRLQRESDLSYLEQMRQFMDKEAFATAVLDCQGPRPANNKHRIFSFSQKANSTKVYCDAALVSRRCPWLRRKIEGAMLGLCKPAPSAPEAAAERSKSVVSVPEPSEEMVVPPPQAVDNNIDNDNDDNNNRKSIPDYDEMDDEQPIHVVDFDLQPSNRNQLPQNNNAAVAKAAQIESDEESTGGEPGSSDLDGMLQVVIPDHSPDAMCLLLEYCYTNRVVCLGSEAFRVAARTKPAPREQKGNLPPNGTKRWANRGEPTCTFEIATASISLAEEASMARFSLMAEIAASHLVTASNVVQALALCSKNAQNYGNPLQRLRKAAMEVVFFAKPYGTLASSVYKQPQFKDAVKAKAPLMIPALFKGTADSVEDSLGKKRYHAFRERDWKSTLYTNFKRFDQEDKQIRARERAKGRKSDAPELLSKEAIIEPLVVDELDLLNAVSDKATQATRKTLKRLRNHSIRNTRHTEGKRKRRDPS